MYKLLFILVISSSFLLTSAQAAANTCCFCFYQAGERSNFEGACDLWRQALPQSCNYVEVAPLRGDVTKFPQSKIESIIRDRSCQEIEMTIAHHGLPSYGEAEISQVIDLSNRFNIDVKATDLGCQSGKSLSSRQSPDFQSTWQFMSHYQVPEGKIASFTGSQSLTGSNLSDGSIFNHTSITGEWRGRTQVASVISCKIEDSCILGQDTTALCSANTPDGKGQLAIQVCCPNRDPNPPHHGWGGGKWLLGTSCPAR